MSIPDLAKGERQNNKEGEKISISTTIATIACDTPYYGYVEYNEGEKYEGKRKDVEEEK